jgi:RNA polymerase sigma-54 factor
VAEYLIDLVDGDGYLRSDLSEVASSLGLDISAIAPILKTLQSFDPPGVCARTLEECLEIQLEERNRCDPLMKQLLAHLGLLAAGDHARLKRVCGVEAEELDDMICEIKALNPRPGSGFEGSAAETLVPDVIVKRGRDGSWHAELNPAAAPALAVDRAYYNALKARCRGDADRAYLSERLASANWLVKSLEQRLATILKVANAVIEEQAAFFDHGVRYLKPLNLRQIAVKIGMHESTVSRVTSNKAMQTPRGLLDMKYFFTSAIAAAGSGSEAHSSEAVRDRIRELIANEEPGDVLSDDRIAALLKAHGIDIARRTVAKYREALRIPSSAARRRKKRFSRAA